ncbi:DUF6090 family protein [Aureitalea marina]|uniref:Uncharacterized protein n=1 Tax=Aureitalea marina TaxID=930804 RepID=A0A2S7KSU7_9FLAO|nr:DUF6090 family protein [Aureitalea marina]PQB05701.1 hypothetical protein BST85_12930 [Aureitalea marina]
MSNHFRKYMVYAIGEIILVVIGILIALQINNWNQGKIEETALQGYLTSISNNIQSDLKKIEYLKQKRIDASSRIPHMTGFLGFIRDFTIRDIKFASETLTTSTDISYLNTDDSGFESIKNSGYLSKLQGQDLENLIYRYYNLVEEIEIKEKDYNQNIREAGGDFIDQEFDYMIYLNFPNYIDGQTQLDTLQDGFREILFHPTAINLFNNAYSSCPELVMYYDNLMINGREIVRMVEQNLKQFDDISRDNLDAIFDPSSDIGYSKVITNGAANVEFFEIGYASYNDFPFSIVNQLNQIDLYVPPIPWATVYYRNPSKVLEDKLTKDFSGYETLRLEVKGSVEGETIQVAIKDDTDPDDGSETKVPISISTEWKTYDIPLSKFETADLSRLFVVASFVFDNKAQNISIRSIEYLK